MTMPLPKVQAPWTPEQVESLNSFQACPWFHAFTCPHRVLHQRQIPEPEGSLTATPAGWVCGAAQPDGTSCGYMQDWAHEFMADGSWRQQAARIGQAVAEMRNVTPADLPRLEAETQALAEQVARNPELRARLKQVLADLDAADPARRARIKRALADLDAAEDDFQARERRRRRQRPRQAEPGEPGD